MYVLGLNAYHGDASACIMLNGELVAAAEEERFNRIKHWGGFPSESIRYCLEEAGIDLSDVDHVAINSNPRANLARKIFHAFVYRANCGLILNRLRNARRRASIKTEFNKNFPGTFFSGQVHQIEHHASHLASAYDVGPFDEAVAVSVDGFGDFSSAAWGLGRDGSVRIEHRVYFPHSLGIFYQALTQYLGFPHYGDEYKVMGLAPYGRPTYLAQMREIVLLNADGSFRLNLNYFRHHRENISYQWNGGTPEIGGLFSTELDTLLGIQRDPDSPLEQHHKDLAHSIQAMYEEAFFHLLNTIYDKNRIDNLVLSGGCAMNSVANGKVKRMTKFKNIYIQSAAGDAGGAIGAAAIVSHKENGSTKRFFMKHAYWGPSYDTDDIGKVIEKEIDAIKAENCHVERVDDEGELCVRVANSIANGEVIGWFQGRMEWGPRALGNRSILGDPRRSDMKDILNLKIKRRESFRPFAPSILRENVVDWFEEENDVPFMMQVFQIKDDKRSLIPAVTHVDGSGRLQTVEYETNARYYNLISAFKDITDIPIVLNTSFNENEPVVCRPDEALSTFLRTKMDVLVLNDWLITRKSS